MSETGPRPELAPARLRALLAPIYQRAERDGRRLGWKERLTSVWRPLYAPFDQLLAWIPEDSSLLDIGCGSGAFLFLANRVRRAAPAYGIDVNAAAIALAQAVNDSAEVRFQVALQPDPDVLASVSVITLIDVLHHVPDAATRPMLSGLIQALPPGGRIVVKDLDPRPRWRALANRITDYLSTRSRVSYISQTEVETLFRESGLRVMDSRRLHKQVWSHYMVVGDKPN